MEPVGFVVAIVVAFVIIIRLLIIYLQQVTEQALTKQFRAAEAVSEGRIPEQWVIQINQQAKRRRALRSLDGKKLEIDLALEKADKLYRYFEKSPFVENDAVRTQLLKQLKQTRDHWKNMTWEELGVAKDVPSPKKQQIDQAQRRD